MNIFDNLKNEIIYVIKQLLLTLQNDKSNLHRYEFGDEFKESKLFEDLKNKVSVEFPKQEIECDLSTNAAMIFAKLFKKSPMELGEMISKELKKKGDGGICVNGSGNSGEAIVLNDISSYIEAIHVVKPGFVNFNFRLDFWSNFLANILKLNKDYGSNNIGEGKKINIEFVSANPTGPMHIGHARSAIYGDALARLMIKCGYSVTREYYINDFGNQIDILGESLWIRLRQIMGDEDIKLVSGKHYPGEYLKEIAQSLVKNGVVQQEDINDREQSVKFLKNIAVECIMKMIQEDLSLIEVYHDTFTSEKYDIIEQNKIPQALNFLQSKGLLYSGKLEKPKSLELEDWEAEEQLLFRSTHFGDDTDRPVLRSDGSSTYFASDIAYHFDKLQRGFDELVLLLGFDHGGYVKRIESIVASLSDNRVPIYILLNQLVNLHQDGNQVRMSKRKGNFVMMRDLIGELGKDILRFMMLTRKNNTVLDLDILKAKEQSKDNPVFYVQYAHARCYSAIKKAYEAEIVSCDEIAIFTVQSDVIQSDVKVDLSDKESSSNNKNQINRGGSKKKAVSSVVKYLYNPDPQSNIDLSLLTQDIEILIIKKIAAYTKIIEAAMKNYELHRITYYLSELANDMHKMWSMKCDEGGINLVSKENLELSRARIALVIAVAMTIGNGLQLLGVKPLLKL